MTAADGSQRVLDQIASYPLKESVAFWHLGDHYGRDRDVKDRDQELDRVRQAIGSIRGMDDKLSRLTTATIDGELEKYARAPLGLDLIGIQPRFWSSYEDFLESYEYLLQRRLLTVRSNLGIPFWAWIPASTPAEVLRNIWGDDPPPSWGTPPVQPEQFRLMTYLALAAGYRGLVYSGRRGFDAFRRAGRALWIEMCFLNLEIDLCEADPRRDRSGDDPSITTFSIRSRCRSPVMRFSTRRSGPSRSRELSPRGRAVAAAVPLLDRKGRPARRRLWRGSPVSAGSARRRQDNGHPGAARGGPSVRDQPAEVRVLPRSAWPSALGSRSRNSIRRA